MTGTAHGIDGVSHQLGQLSGSMNAVFSSLAKQESGIESLHEKLDEAAKSRDLIFSELRSLKHDQRNVEMKVDAVAAMHGRLDIRVQDIEKLRHRLAGLVAGFGMVGTLLGWIILHFVGPIIDRIRP